MRAFTRIDPGRQLPAPPAAPPLDGEALLGLARTDTPQSVEQLERYAPEEVAEALQQLPARRRMEFLELSDRVDEIVPLMTEADFATTVIAAGIEENGWLVEFATPEQRVAAVDLDCWQDFRFSPSRLFAWIDAMIEAGPEVLAASFDELDPELWILAMKRMASWRMPGREGDEGEDFGTGGGLAHYEAFSAEDEDRLRAILGTALLFAPGHYERLVYGAMFESERECAEFAAGWQRGRLGDLGFPDRAEAMRVYQPLRVEETPLVDLDASGEQARARQARSRASQVPSQLGTSLVGRALAELSGERASEVMRAILSVANSLAVADKLPLAEPETVEGSLAKALRGIDAGLAEAARAQGHSLAAVLQVTDPRDLFRIGVTLDTSLRPRTTWKDLLQREADAEGPGDDWNVTTEVIDEGHRTVDGEGRLR